MIIESNASVPTKVVIGKLSNKSNISEHIKHIFAEGELDKESVVRKFRTTAIKQTVKEVKSSLRGK